MTSGIDPRDEVVFAVPTMEFSASSLKKVAKRHSLCSHPWDLSCALFGRAREVAERYTTRQLTLDKMGVPRSRGGTNGNGVS